MVLNLPVGFMMIVEMIHKSVDFAKHPVWIVF